MNFGTKGSPDSGARWTASSTGLLPPQLATTTAAPSERPSPVSTLRRLSPASESGGGSAGSGASRSGTIGIAGGLVAQSAGRVGLDGRGPLVDMLGGVHGPG